MKRFIAGPNEEGVRLSRFVEGVTQGLPTSLLYKSFRNKRIKVNGKKAAPDARLAKGDCIELYINDEFFLAQPAAPAAKAAPAKRTVKQPKLTVLYEDDNIAVLYKPVHLLCHSDRTGDANLVDAFTAYLTEKGEYDPHAESRFSPAVCNRLDRGTEGLVVAAKNYAALRDMNEIIRTDLLKKEYYTITVGIPKSGRFTAWWEHDEKLNKVRIHAHEDAAGVYKQIITDVDVLKTAGPFALCKIGLVTGRTHQIRAHLAFLGQPVLGDIKYGNRKMNERTGTKTQALCAVRLSFLDIPEASTLHYLSGKVVKLKDPAILRQFDALDKNAGREAGGEGSLKPIGKE
jgi:23S rRNA pseudouridine955/2504/2580 synthase